MPLIDYIDPETRRVHLSADSVGVDIHPIDIYREARALRRTDENLRKYDLFMRAAGNLSKGSGKYTERYVVLLNGTRIVPYNVSQTLNIVGTVITDAGQSGRDCFDRLGLSVGVEVDIDYQPPQVEVVQVSTGSGLQPSEQTQLATTTATVSALQDMLLSIYELHNFTEGSETTLTTTDIANTIQAIFAHRIEGSETFNQAMALIRGEAAGGSEVDGNTVRIKSADGAKDRIVATIGPNGERQSVITDGT